MDACAVPADAEDQNPAQGRPARTVLQRQLQQGAPPRRATALDDVHAGQARASCKGNGSTWAACRPNSVSTGQPCTAGWAPASSSSWKSSGHWLNARLSDQLKRVEAEDITGNRIARLLSRFVSDCLSIPGMRQFQRDEEGAFAFRLLTLARYGFHPRFVLLVRDLLAEDVAAARLETTVPLEDLAYTAVRVVESYVHRAAIAAMRNLTQTGQRAYSGKLSRADRRVRRTRCSRAPEWTGPPRKPASAMPGRTTTTATRRHSSRLSVRRRELVDWLGWRWLHLTCILVAARAGGHPRPAQARLSCTCSSSPRRRL